MSAALAPAAYEPRLVRSHGVWTEGEWRVKAYTIAHGARAAADPATLDAVRRLAFAGIAAHADGFEHHAAGFAIFHMGADGDYLLTFWWHGENMLAARIHIGSREKIAAMEDRTATGLMPCVWEMEVIGFERDAWVECVLTPGGGGVDAYLSRALEGMV
jgi:hypothetical protein